MCSQLHTLAILNAHSFRVGENVKFNILEDIALRDPGSLKVRFSAIYFKKEIFNVSHRF